MSLPAKIVTTSLRRFARALQRVTVDEVIARSFDRWACALVVRDHGKGAPSYREGADAAVYRLTVATASLPSSPNTTPPGALAFDLAAFGAACLYWQPSDAEVATISATIWAESDDGVWLKVATVVLLAPYTETLVTGLGYRRIFVQTTAKGAGADGNLFIAMAGA